MLLGILLSILTATYTLNSTTSVEQTGTAPTSSIAMYERTATTGQKGQMTAGNSTRLELSGWDGCTIVGIELQMRSNTSSGAGSLVVQIGKDTLWSVVNKGFNDDQWAGQFSTELVTIDHSFHAIVGEDEHIEILISAIENSLYINSYTIHYEPASPQCYTATFYTGLDTCPITLTQTQPGEALILPAWQDTACWYFMGWTEQEVLDNKLLTSIMPIGSSYVPSKNIKLWSVYSNHKENTPITKYESGPYVVAICNELTEKEGGGMVLTGDFTDEHLHVKPVQMFKNENDIYCLDNTITEDMLFDVIFLDDFTLSLAHHTTNYPIGHTKDKLAFIDVPWQYLLLEDGSIVIYYQYNSDDYALYVGYQANEVLAYAQELKIDRWTSQAFWLYPMIEKEYTSWPFGKFEAVDNIFRPSYTGDAILQWGIYELHIQDGKKIIYLKH